MTYKSEVVTEFFDAELRCEKMIPIYMCLAETPSQDLLDAIFEEEDVCELLGLPLDIETEQNIIDKLKCSDTIGFLAEFATPKPIRFSNSGNSWVSGWGYYQKKWFYAEHLETLREDAVNWAYEHFEQCKNKEMNSK